MLAGSGRIAEEATLGHQWEQAALERQRRGDKAILALLAMGIDTMMQ
jgi:hypothetical protein